MKVIKQKKIKLTENQECVIALLQSGGWELGSSHGFFTSETIQKGGLGYGGTAVSLRAGMCLSLLNKGVIKQDKSKGNWRITVYELTDAGKAYQVGEFANSYCTIKNAQK